MDQRVSLITLAVQDIDRAATFYEALDWSRVQTTDGVIAFDLIGQVLGLYPAEALAKETGIAVSPAGTSNVVLSYNVRNKAQVAPLLERAKAAGGRILNEASDVFWGGHHGHFADPDGTIWEVAWNPYSPLGPDGAFCWNGYGTP